MQSKKIIAATMALLLAVGGVAPTLGTGTFPFGVTASAAPASSDTNLNDKSTDEEKMNYAEQVANWEANKIKDTASETTDTAALAKAIDQIVARVNAIPYGVEFTGTNVDLTTIGSDTFKGTFSVTNFSTGDKTATATLNLSFKKADNSVISKNIAVTVNKDTAPTAESISASIAQTLSNTKITTATTDADVKGLIDAAIKANSAYTGATYSLVGFNKGKMNGATTIHAAFAVTLKDKTSTVKSVIMVQTDDNAFAEIVANAVDSIKNAATEKAGNFGSNTPLPGAVSIVEGAGNVDGLNSATVTATSSYTAPTYGAAGSFVGKIHFVYGADITKTKDVDLNIVIEALKKTPNQELSEANAAVQKAASDYKYKTTTNTTIEEVEAVAKDAAAKAGATLTPTGNYSKAPSSLNFDYTITFPGADLNLGTQSVKFDILTAQEKADAAKAEIQKAIDSNKITNDTTADSYLKMVNDIAAKYGTVANWSTTDPFVLLKSTFDTEGKSTGTIVIKDSNVSFSVAKTVEKISWVAPTDAKGIVENMKAAVAKAFSTPEAFYSECYTTSDNWDKSAVETTGQANAVNAKAVADKAICNAYGITYYSGWNENDKSIYSPAKGWPTSTTVTSFSCTEPTATTDGSASGKIEINYSGTKDVVDFSFTLHKFYTLDQRLAAGKEAVSAALASYSATAATTEADIVKLAQDAVNAKGYWLDASVFYKYGNTPTTISNDGKKVTGTLQLKSSNPKELTVVTVPVDMTIKSDTDKFNGASLVANNAVAAISATNDTTFADIKLAVDKALTAAKYDTSVYVLSETVNKVVVTKATETTAGAVTGQVALTDGKQTSVININLPISQLMSSADILNGAKKAVDDATASFAATNEATDKNVLEFVNQAIKKYTDTLASKPSVVATWDGTNGFKLEKATAEKDGSVTGTVNISYSGIAISTTLNLKVSKDALTDAEKVAEAKKLATDAIAALKFTNDTTADDVLTAVTTAIKPTGVAATWDTVSAFVKTDATYVAAGAVTGKINFVLNQEKGSVDVAGTIDQLGRVSIAKATVAKISNRVYTGKAIKPSVKVTVDGVVLKKSDYTVKYSKNVATGKATVNITGVGKYTGSVTKTFIIVPKKTVVKSVKAGKKSVKATWKKTTGATGYYVQVSKSSKFTSGNKGSFTKATSKTVAKLTSKKAYFVRIRAYKTVSGKNYYGSWSTAKKVTVK